MPSKKSRHSVMLGTAASLNATASPATLRLRLFGSLIGALALGGCATAVSVGVRQETPVEDVIAASSNVSKNYQLMPGDSITVRFYFNPQLDEDLVVRSDGNISLSLIGELKAAGLTPERLSQDITNAYSKYFNRSNAVVIVRQFEQQRVFVAGEVFGPGRQNIIPGTQTVLQAIAAAGSVTDNADLEEVILVRQLPTQTEPMVTVLNLKEALSGADTRQNLNLMPNDLVYVPKSGLANANLAMHLWLLNNLNFSTSVNASHQID